jgi:conserved oligomeric Golgi complex subunit 8
MLQGQIYQSIWNELTRNASPCSVFEIATQFNAIFRASPGRDTSSSASLLSMWTTRRIHSFLNVLNINLNRMQDSAALRDALEACVFFATSMGRLGGDFTAQLAPLFEPKMASLVTNQWKDGVNQFQETLTVCRDAGVASPLVSLTATATASGTTPDQPPRQLLAYPPLARLVNSYLVGLNELRRCLLPGIFGILRKDMKKSLSSVKAILDTNHRAVNAPGLRGEATELREVASQMLTVWEELVDPYLLGALEVALGNFVVAKELLEKSQKFNEEETKEEEPELEDEEVDVETLAEQGGEDEVTPAVEEETPTEPAPTDTDRDAPVEIINEDGEGGGDNDDDADIYA